MKTKMKIAWLAQYRATVTGAYRKREHCIVMNIAAESKPDAEKIARTVFRRAWPCYKIISVDFKKNCYDGFILGPILVERKQ